MNLNAYFTLKLLSNSGIHFEEFLNQIRPTSFMEVSEIVHEKPVPRVVIDKFAPGYMEMKARFWVEKKYALVGRWGLNEKIKTRFDEEGITMASPRLDINEISREQV